VNKKRYEKDAAGQDVLCEMPGLKNLGCCRNSSAGTSGKQKPDEPSDLLGILARKIFAWKISCTKLRRTLSVETTAREICQVVSWLRRKLCAVLAATVSVQMRRRTMRRRF
jgi:hypothetical protein